MVNVVVRSFSAITYKVVIKTGKQLGGSTTTAQAWMTLAGSITDTGVMNIPKNENEFRFQVKDAIKLRNHSLDSSLECRLLSVPVFSVCRSFSIAEPQSVINLKRRKYYRGPVCIGRDKTG